MMENFKDLLYAILRSDEFFGKRQKFAIIVYDTLNYDLPIAIFNNSKTCAKFFNTSSENIRCGICRNILQKKRYRLERLNLEGEN